MITQNVIDLHSHLILKGTNINQPGEIIEFQINYCAKELDNAIVNNLDKVIVIHGGGKGVLKRKLIQLLEELPFIKEYKDASILHYGLGATEVTFK